MGFVRRHCLWVGVALFIVQLFPQFASAADVSIQWDANTESILSGYKVYYGTASRSYTKSVSVGNQTSYTVQGISGGTWYFAVTSVSTSGLESDYSNEVSRYLDTAVPVISSVRALNVLTSGATITWTTDKASSSQVEYGLTSAYGSSSSLNATLVTAHSQALSGLASGTLYHYRVKSQDSAGNLSTSPDYTFTTGQSSDTTSPVISAVAAGSITTSGAVISWTTNEASDSMVAYGLTTAYGSSTAVNTTKVTAHSQALSGLQAGKLYHFRLQSRDSAGNLAISGDYTFTTAGLVSSVPAFVQMRASSTGPGNAISATFSASNTAGNLIVAYVIWDNSGPVTLSDSRGNSYSSAVGPTRYGTNRANAQVFYARNVAGGANTVKAAFSTAITSFALIYIHEYSGVDTVSPFESAVTGAGSSTSMSIGPLVTRSSNALLFAAGVSGNAITSGGTGFSVRSTYCGNMTQDRVAAAAGSYTVNLTQNGSFWIQQLIAFKSRSTTQTQTDAAPPQITGVSASGASTGATITWTTNEPSNSQVEYGLTTAYGTSSTVNSNMVTSHSVALSGLSTGSLYHYRVTSRDAAGNLAVSGDFTFSAAAASTATVPKFVQAKELMISSGSSVSVSFPYSNTVGNLIVAYVLWDNSSPVTVSDSRGNSYSSAIGPNKYIGDRTNAQIFYARNIYGGTNAVTVRFSTPVTQWGLLYIHEYSGVDKVAPLIAAKAQTGSSAAMNSGYVATTAPNALLFAAATSSGSVNGPTIGFTQRSAQYGNLTEDRIAVTPSTYNASSTQNSTAWIMQLVAFKAAVQQSGSTTMVLPLLSTANQLQAMSSVDEYVGLALVNSDSAPADVTVTAVDSTGKELATSETITLKPGEQLRTLDRQLFGESVQDSGSDGWIKVESSTDKIGGQYALFDEGLSTYQGSTISAEQLRTIIIPEIGKNGNTKFTAVNPTAEPGVVSFDLVSADGTVRNTADRTIGPNAFVTSDSLAELYTDFEPEVTDYIRVRASSGLQAFEFVREESGDSSIVSGLDQGAGAHTLYATQFAATPRSKSSITLINLDSKEGVVTIKLFGKNSLQAGETRQYAIPANGKISIDEFARRIQGGYAEIHSDEVRLSGVIKTEATIPGKRSYSSALPLVSSLRDTVLLSNMAQDALFSSAVMVLNPGDNEVSATVELYTSDGRMIASAADSIPAHRQQSRLVREYFPEIVGQHWDSGYVIIRSTEPVAAFSQVECSETGLVSVVPPQDIR